MTVGMRRLAHWVWGVTALVFTLRFAQLARAAPVEIAPTVAAVCAALLWLRFYDSFRSAAGGARPDPAHAARYRSAAQSFAVGAAALALGLAFLDGVAFQVAALAAVVLGVCAAASMLLNREARSPEG